jgi:hypothetical protein
MSPPFATAQQTNFALGGHQKPPFTYERRRPELSVLHKVVRENLATFLEICENQKGGLPCYVKEEFADFLECGILAHGFLRLRCEDCHHEKLIAFSCRHRGFCPSCCGKRQALTTAFVMDEVLPLVPIRQYVLSFPFAVRFVLATRPKVMTAVLKIVNHHIHKLLVTKISTSNQNELESGQVSFIQRWGSALNLNCHFHILVPEGLWHKDLLTNAPKFNALLSAPNNDDIAALVTVIAKKVNRYLQKRGLIKTPNDAADMDDPTLMDTLLGASVKSLISIGDRAGQKVRRLGTLHHMDFEFHIKGTRCVAVDGYSLHANTFCDVHERAKLERLVGYVARPPLAEGRFSIRPNGDVTYKLKNPYQDGTTHVIFTPIEFLEKLAALVPKPRAHLVRYAGVFSRHSALRPMIIPKKLRQSQESENSLSGEAVEKKVPSEQSKNWARLLKRVFGIDMNRCSHCSSENVKIVAAIMEQKVIEKILTHLGLSSEVPKIHPARAPPQGSFDWGT